MKYCEKPSQCAVEQTEIRMCVNSASPNATFQNALHVKPFDIDESGNYGKSFLFPAQKMLVGQINSSIQVLGPRPTGGSNNCFKAATINGCRH